jgi:hypothetical protein
VSHAVPTPAEPALTADGDEARARAQAAHWRLPFEPLANVSDEAELWAQVPLDLMVRFGAVPIGRRGRRLVVAFGDVSDIQKADELEFLLGVPIEAAVAPESRVAQLLKRRRGGDLLL